MPRRTAVIYQVGYHKRGEPAAKRNHLELGEIAEGKSFIDLVSSCWTQEQLNALDMPLRDRRIEILEVTQSRSVTLLKAQAGIFGEPGEYKDAETGEIYHNDESGSAAKMGVLRVGYLQPAGNPIYGYVVVEGSPNGNLREQFLRLMRQELSKLGKYTLTFDRVMSGDEWLKTRAEIEKVIVFQERPATDKASSIDWIETATRFRVEVSPEKGKRIFAKGALKKFTENTFNPRTLVSVPEVEGEQTKIQLGDGERSKLMAVDNLQTPGLLEILSEEGSPALTDTEFAKWVEKRVATLEEESPQR